MHEWDPRSFQSMVVVQNRTLGTAGQIVEQYVQIVFTNESKWLNGY